MKKTFLFYSTLLLSPFLLFAQEQTSVGVNGEVKLQAEAAEAKDAKTIPPIRGEASARGTVYWQAQVGPVKTQVGLVGSASGASADTIVDSRTARSSSDSPGVARVGVGGTVTVKTKKVLKAQVDGQAEWVNRVDQAPRVKIEGNGSLCLPTPGEQPTVCLLAMGTIIASDFEGTSNGKTITKGALGVGVRNKNVSIEVLGGETSTIDTTARKDESMIIVQVTASGDINSAAIEKSRKRAQKTAPSEPQ